MKVLFLLNSYEEDGPGWLLYRLCERWAPMREVMLTTIALGRGGPLAERLSRLGVGTQVIPVSGPSDAKKLREAGERICHRADRPDIIHSHCVWPDMAARWFHSGIEHIPLMSSVYGMYHFSNLPMLKRAATRMREKRTRQWCSALAVGSEVFQKALIDYGIPPDMIRLIPMGIDAVQCFPLSESTKTRFRSLMNLPEGSRLLLSAGRLEKVKGHDLLIDAMPEIVRAHPETRLFIVGEGPEREALVRQIARLKLQDHVRLIGQLSDVLTKLLSVADLVIHPSRQEAFAMIVAEAQSAGTPVVASRDGMIPDLVRDGETGVLLPPGNSGAISEAVNRLLADRAHLEEMGGRAREYMMEYHELSNTANSYIELWRDLAPEADWKATDSIPIEDLEEMVRESEQPH